MAHYCDASGRRRSFAVGFSGWHLHDESTTSCPKHFYGEHHLRTSCRLFASFGCHLSDGHHMAQTLPKPFFNP